MSQKRVLLNIPEDFLRTVDAEAAAEHRSRSELVREALRQYLSEPQQESRGSRRSAAAAKLAEARRTSVGKAIKGSELIRRRRYRHER